MRGSGSLIHDSEMTIREQARSYRRAAGMLLWTSCMLGGARVHMGLRSHAPRFVGQVARRESLSEMDLSGTARSLRQVFRAWEQPWAEWLLWWFGMRLHVVGEVPPPTGRGRLVIANHRSPVDILIVLARIGGCLLSRGDVADWPVLGPAASAAGTIFVDRSERSSGAAAVREMRRRLQQGEQVVVFPEGGTFAGDEVRPFRRGAFTAAVGLPVDILPIAFAYPPGCEFLEDDFQEHMIRVAQRQRTHVGVAIGQPYPLVGSTRQAADEAQQVVQKLAHQARAAVS